MKIKNKSTFASLVCILLITMVSASTIGILSLLGVKTNKKCSGVNASINMIQAQVQSIDSTYFFTGKFEGTEEYLHIINVGLTQAKQFYDFNDETERKSYEDLETYTANYISTVEEGNKDTFRSVRNAYLNVLTENAKLAQSISVKSSVRNETATTIGTIFIIIFSTISFALVVFIDKKQNEKDLLIQKKNDTIASKNNIINDIAYSDIMTQLQNKYAMIETVETPSENNRVIGMIYLEGLEEIKRNYGFNACDTIRTEIANILQKMKEYKFYAVDDATIGFIYNTEETLDLYAVNNIKNIIQLNINRNYFFKNQRIIDLKSNVCTSILASGGKTVFDVMYVELSNERNKNMQSSISRNVN